MITREIDIFITSYLRQDFTKKTLGYLKERTKKSSYNLFLIDNGGNSEFRDDVDYYVGFGQNMGIHASWNTALALATTDYFVTADNDLLVPDLKPDWLEQMVKIMDDNPEYGAVSMHPHVFIGAANVDPDSVEGEVVERNMCGAVFRVMRRSAVMQVGGWEHKVDPRRNHEERTICSRLQSADYKVGITPKIRAYHMFGTNWGYPTQVTPEMHGHNPELDEYVQQFDNIEAYDSKTWMPKS